jgi:hypothetical protein
MFNHHEHVPKSLAPVPLQVSDSVASEISARAVSNITVLGTR